MSKTRPSHIAALPADLKPSKSSTQLINEHVERLRAQGVRQKVIALALGFEPNYISMLKAGEELPLPRVLAFADAAKLNPTERHELLHTRLLELHGEKGEICLETLVHWADQLFSPAGDEAVLVELWKEAASPAPQLVAGLLKDPAKARRVEELLVELVQAELKTLSEEASLP